MDKNIIFSLSTLLKSFGGITVGKISHRIFRICSFSRITSKDIQPAIIAFYSLLKFLFEDCCGAKFCVVFRCGMFLKESFLETTKTMTYHSPRRFSFRLATQRESRHVDRKSPVVIEYYYVINISWGFSTYPVIGWVKLAVYLVTDPHWHFEMCNKLRLRLATAEKRTASNPTSVV